MAEIVVREAVGADDVATVRGLMQAYGDYLAANPTGRRIFVLRDMRRSWRDCLGRILLCCSRLWMVRLRVVSLCDVLRGTSLVVR
jgi:hypothetical protein